MSLTNSRWLALLGILLTVGCLHAQNSIDPELLQGQWEVVDEIGVGHMSARQPWGGEVEVTYFADREARYKAWRFDRGAVYRDNSPEHFWNLRNVGDDGYIKQRNWGIAPLLRIITPEGDEEFWAIELVADDRMRLSRMKGPRSGPPGFSDIPEPNSLLIITLERQ